MKTERTCGVVFLINNKDIIASFEEKNYSKAREEDTPH
jgi:hypothetical protein